MAEVSMNRPAVESASQTHSIMGHTKGQHLDRYLFVVVGIFVLVGPLIFPTTTATEMLIFSIIAVSTNIMVGYTGLLSFGQASFFGIGAYACGLLLKAEVPILLAIPIATSGTMLVAMIVGYFCVQRTGLYFICLTFAFNQFFYFVAYVWTDVTGGEDGLPGIPRADFIADSTNFYIFVAAILIVSLLAMKWIVDSPLGLVFKLIRENPERAAAIGYDVRKYKWTSFVIASTFTALAGTLYCMLYRIVPIDQIHWLKSGDFIFMVLFGGSGNFFGPMIGAVAFIWLSDTFSLIWSRWLLLMGIVFAIVVLFFRGGVVELIERGYAYLMRSREKVSIKQKVEPAE